MTGLHRRLAALPPPYSYCLFDRDDEYLAVSYLAGLRGLLDDGEHVVEHRIVDNELDLYLGHEAYLVFRATVELHVSLLPAVAFDLRDGHTGHARLVQGFLYFLQLERLYDCLYLFH